MGTREFQDFAEEQWHRCFDKKEEWERYCEEKGIKPYPNKIDLEKLREERQSD